MIYIISGDEPYLIESKLKEIISLNEDAIISKFNGLFTPNLANDIVESCSNQGLFSSESLVLVKDPYFLIKKSEDKYTSSLIDYCHKPLFENTLVFYTYDDLFNDKLKVYKEISVNSQVIKLNKLQRRDFYPYAKSLIKNAELNITKDAEELLISNANYDLSLLKQNINVLSIYPDRIDNTAVNKLITFSSDEDVFSLINALTNRKASLAIKYANKLMENDESILRLISSLASQLRFLYAVDYYRSNGKNTNEIMKILNVKSSYRIEKAFDSLKQVDAKTIESLLSKLSDLDYQCKSDYDIDDKLKLELFIVSLLG